VNNLRPLKVCLLIGGHLATAPRPQKEAAALRDAGFEVCILGGWWNDDLAKEDLDLASRLSVRFKPVVDIRPNVSQGRLTRLKNRLARELFSHTRICLPRSIGLNAPELLKNVAKENANLVIAHCEAGLWVAKQIKNVNVKIGVDFEDWFSHDLLPRDRANRPVRTIEKLENWCLKNADLTITTSQSLSDALCRHYRSIKKPLVIPNVFPWKERADLPPKISTERDFVSLYWYSQTIGPGRGLELLGHALNSTHGNWRLNLRGRLSNSTWLEQTFSKSVLERTHILPPVPNDALLAANAEHDIGLALEIPHCESRNLTVTNKFFDYMRAGLAVIATKTEGQAWAFQRTPNVGRLVSFDSADELANCINSLIASPLQLQEMKKNSLLAAEKIWAWEHFSTQLVDSVRRLLR
jgi:glycosyltransferase involved in cell wall biosynthesis